ncbi:MAG TPA: hypothetical protein VKB95_13600, partial [Chitinophagaceae bacterium]|nr:hypothetical protein [Chitinophagaceae bacterium]
MKIKNYVLPAMLALFTISFAQAQTVDEIISKHIDAIGGKEKLSQVKSVYTESSVEVMGNSAPQKEYLVEGKGFKSELDFSGTSIIQCFTDKSGWMVNPMAGGTDAQAIPDAVYKSGKPQIYMGGALVNYAAKGYKAELMGKDGGSFKIKVTGDGNETYYFIDLNTYLLTKSIIKGEVMGQAVDVTTTYSDYKKTDFGIMLPYAKNMDMGMFQLAQKTEKIEVNKEIDLKIFDMPK